MSYSMRKKRGQDDSTLGCAFLISVSVSSFFTNFSSALGAIKGFKDCLGLASTLVSLRSSFAALGFALLQSSVPDFAGWIFLFCGFEAASVNESLALSLEGPATGGDGAFFVAVGLFELSTCCDSDVNLFKAQKKGEYLNILAHDFSDYLRQFFSFLQIDLSQLFSWYAEEPSVLKDTLSGEHDKEHINDAPE